MAPEAGLDLEPPRAPGDAGWLLRVEDLRVTHVADGHEILRGVEFRVAPDQRVGIVGESGSGKSMTASVAMGLLARGLEVTSGRVLLGDRDLTQATEAELRDLRGSSISIVYQNAVTSLNPVVPVGEQIARVARAHDDLSKTEARERAVELLDAFGIPEARRKARDYPHQFSGDMAQRAAIAMALVCSPKLLIADEPTTGLDATIQAQVLDVIDRSVDEWGTALLLISHDLEVIQAMCDHVVVMYAGVVLEAGPCAAVLSRPLSPYTQGLLRCFRPENGEITFIPGRVPEPGTIGECCPFAARCDRADDVCRTSVPRLRELEPGHAVACHHA